MSSVVFSLSFVLNDHHKSLFILSFISFIVSKPQVHDAQLQLCHLKEPSGKDASSPLRNGLVDPEVIRQKLADHKSSAEKNGEKETLELRRLTEELDQVRKENAVWKQQALTLRGMLRSCNALWFRIEKNTE